MNTITADQFKEGMRLLTGAVTIVTTEGEAGKGGLTATAICSVSDAPPTLLVCINKENDLNEVINNNGEFAVNILSVKHEDLANRFAGFVDGITVEERFLEGDWINGDTNSPILSDALVVFECTWKKSISEGSHQIVLGEIVNTYIGEEDSPLLYFNRNYRKVQ